MWPNIGRRNGKINCCRLIMALNVRILAFCSAWSIFFLLFFRIKLFFSLQDLYPYSFYYSVSFQVWGTFSAQNKVWAKVVSQVPFVMTRFLRRNTMWKCFLDIFCLYITCYIFLPFNDACNTVGTFHHEYFKQNNVFFL